MSNRTRIVNCMDCDLEIEAKRIGPKRCPGCRAIRRREIDASPAVKARKVRSALKWRKHHPLSAEHRHRTKAMRIAREEAAHRGVSVEIVRQEMSLETRRAYVRKANRDQGVQVGGRTISQA